MKTPAFHRKTVARDPRHRTPEQRQHFALSISDRRFVEEYLLDLNARAAGVRAGLAPNVGSFLLGQQRIQFALERERAKRQTRTEIYADEVLRRWWLLATADVRELVQLRRGACRHCYGIDNQYQFTKNELRRAVQRHQQMQLDRRIPEANWVSFNDLGGDGYDATKTPAKDCTECFGVGLPLVWLADSRDYSAAAAVLYDGVKVSKDGTVELKLRDRSAALENVAKHLGMLVQRQAIVTIDPTQLSDEQLDTVLRQFAVLDGCAEAPVIEHEEADASDAEFEDEEEVDQAP